jgi:hypothetical protein
MEPVRVRAGDNLDVFWTVVGFDVVDVVRHFTGTKTTTKLLLGDKPVFVGITTNISQVVSLANLD